ncbi:stress response protein NST1-like [Stylophora pistillata]|uniref:stress response protein NST1-like n=1 Tax=Stylophora pistillata TaxID=50429 RepID=UPI000C04C530|nr:stress response protein NST1-like [Stylophora pistillata]
MLFSDDTALVAHNAADIQLLVHEFARAAARFRLKINIKRTECLFQPVKPLSPSPGPESIMREKKNILELLKRRQDAQEEELKQNLKLEQDVEMEKLRKEVSISKRFALKESQNQLIQNLVKDAKLNEEQANAIMKNHLANMAAIDKATDDERDRRVMALEKRLAERRALAKQKHEEEERKKRDLDKLEQNHAEALENLVRSSNLNSEDAATYLERFRKDLEVVNNKLAKDRKRQEQKLHHKLTALKQKRIEEKFTSNFEVDFEYLK